MPRHPLYLVARTFVLLFFLSLFGFAFLTSMPGDPLDRMLEDNPDFTFEDYQRLRNLYGLDDPVQVRYLKWAFQSVQGNLGYSRQYKIPVSNLVAPRLQNTFILAGLSLFFGLAGALLLGLLYSVSRHWLLDLPLRTLILFDSSLPAFWLGLMLIVLFSVGLHWLPPGGIMSSDVQPGLWNVLTDRLRYLIMPVLALSVTHGASWARYARNNMASGSAESAHSFRDWTLAVLTIAGTRFAPLLAAVVIVETVFSYPGAGKILFDSVMGNDFVVSMAVLMILINVSVWVGFFADISVWLMARLRDNQSREASASESAAEGPVLLQAQDGRQAQHEPGPEGAVAVDQPGRTITALRWAAVILGLSVLCFVWFFSYAGPSLSPYQPDQVNLRERFARPSLGGSSTGVGVPDQPQAQPHQFGTDDLGRDTMTRVMYGGRVTFGIAFLVAIYGVVITAIFGGLGSLMGKFWDYIADPVVSFRNALPDLPVLLVLAKVLPPGFWTICFVLILLNRVGGVRFGRSRQSNVAGLAGLAVAAAVYAGWAIGLETAVSYLGVGIQPPTPSWGNMLSNSQQYFFSAPYLVVLPGAFILFALLALNLVADGIRRIPEHGAIGR